MNRRDFLKLSALAAAAGASGRLAAQGMNAASPFKTVLKKALIAKRFDARALQTYLTEAMAQPDLAVLSDCKPGGKAVVEKFGRNLAPDAVTGLNPGDAVTVEGFSLDRSSVRVTVGGKTLDVPIRQAENIWCRPQSI